MDKIHSLGASPPTFHKGSATRILTLAGLLLILHSIALKYLQADFAESNFQSNLVRIQSYLFGPHHDVVLAGSSISGRLLPRYFAAHGVLVANLGLDGSGVRVAMDIIRQRPDLPSTILLEIYSLLREPDTNDRILQEAMRSPSFLLSRYLPVMRAAARPSALLYSKLKKYSDQLKVTSSFAPALVKTLVQTEPTNRMLSVEDEAIEADKADWLAQIAFQFPKTYLLRIPTGPFSTPRKPDFIDHLAHKTNIPVIDLTLTSIPFTYTDGRHLDAVSAEAACAVITDQLRSHP